MSADRVCVLGCTVRDLHFATCPWFGVDTAPTEMEGSCPWPLCQGCVPAEARDGVMVCEACYRRFRWHLNNAPDLIGRLRSLADPTKAKAIEWLPGSGMTVAPAPVADDLVDAADDITRILRSWAGEAGGMPAGMGSATAFQMAHRCTLVILEDLDRIANRVDLVTELAEACFARHPRDADGVRDRWSIRDGIDQYRLERPDDRITYVDPRADDGIIAVFDVPEQRDEMVPWWRAVQLVPETSLRRWMKTEEIAPAFTYGRTRYFRWSELEETRERMAEKATSSRFAKT